MESQAASLRIFEVYQIHTTHTQRVTLFFFFLLNKISYLLSHQFTSLYGIRTYTRNSILEMHTDTSHTHAASAIINVAQEVDSDWPLEIYDHDRVMHEVMMQVTRSFFFFFLISFLILSYLFQPGEFILYEVIFH